MADLHESSSDDDEEFVTAYQDSVERRRSENHNGSRLSQFGGSAGFEAQRFWSCSPETYTIRPYNSANMASIPWLHFRGKRKESRDFYRY